MNHCKISLILLLFITSFVFGIDDDYLLKIKREKNDMELESVKHCEKMFLAKNKKIYTAILKSNYKKFLLIYEKENGQNKTLYIYSLFGIDFENESINDYRFFKGAPLLIEYMTSEKRYDASVSKTLRFLFYKEQIVLVYDKYLIKKENIKEYKLDIPIVGEKENKKQIKEAKEYTEKGNALFKKGDFKKASVMYKKALIKNPNNFIVHNNLGYSYMRLALYEYAERQFYYALACNILLEQAYKNLVSLYERTGESALRKNALVKYARLKGSYK